MLSYLSAFTFSPAIGITSKKYTCRAQLIALQHNEYGRDLILTIHPVTK